MGPLFFALPFQPAVRVAREHAADAIVTACYDDTYLLGKEDADIAGARRIISHHACQPRRTQVSCADPTRPATSPRRSGQRSRQAESSHVAQR